MNKGQRVQAMFDNIAEHYDLMNRLMTFGQDRRWRRFVVDRAMDFTQASSQDKATAALDLATGTGDIAALLKERFPEAHVTGGDFSRFMLKKAETRFSDQEITWTTCDANELPFEDHVFDAVTFGFLLRNVESVHRVLGEVYRVLKPGGRIVCLDTTPPRRGLMAPLIKLHFRVGIPVLGRLIARDRQAYQYLTQSTLDFIPANDLIRHFEQAGFEHNAYKTFMFHTIAVHWGQKPG